MSCPLKSLPSPRTQHRKAGLCPQKLPAEGEQSSSQRPRSSAAGWFPSALIFQRPGMGGGGGQSMISFPGRDQSSLFRSHDFSSYFTLHHLLPHLTKLREPPDFHVWGSRLGTWLTLCIPGPSWLPRIDSPSAGSGRGGVVLLGNGTLNERPQDPRGLCFGEHCSTCSELEVLEVYLLHILSLPGAGGWGWPGPHLMLQQNRERGERVTPGIQSKFKEAVHQ